ncbi:MAG: GerMN domain-containing protein [Actinobacteria bacterium]|nr:GerMN domain-containing protein [Actinomycetota bacterium]
MKRIAVVAVLVGLVLGGLLAASCGSRDEAVPVGAADTSATEEPGNENEAASGGDGSQPSTTNGQGTSETAEEEPATEGTVRYEVWFHRGEHLFVTHRSEGATLAVGRASLEALLDGPDVHETQRDVESAVPDGTDLLGLDIDDGVATVDLTSEFESGGGSLSMTIRLAQVVYTLTQFPTVDAVQFMLDGERVDVFSAQGIVLDHPVRRRDYAELLPPILVTSPGIEDTVENPVTIEGSANVFEANVTIRVEDAAGKELARTFTTATCGSGCRGTFSASVRLRPTDETHAFVILSDDDADGDGRPSYEVEVPVRLS